VVPILSVRGLLDAGEKSGSRHNEERGALVNTEDEPKRNVLIVEDSLTTRELMKNIVRSAGYSVEVASDGIEALNVVAGKDLDLIITDIEMPRMNGFEMTQRLKKDPATKDIPVIMVTALFLDEEKKRGLEVGADAYIKKGDFDQSKLVETIDRLVV
jgi:two-component system chemotaxis sensor kinase CheA